MEHQKSSENCMQLRQGNQEKPAQVYSKQFLVH